MVQDWERLGLRLSPSAREMTAEAGFREFELLAIENPMNNYYLPGK